MWEFCPTIYLCTMYMQDPQSEQRARVTDGHELPYRCWELNPGLLEEQPVVLATEVSFLPHAFSF